MLSNLLLRTKLTARSVMTKVKYLLFTLPTIVTFAHADEKNPFPSLTTNGDVIKTAGTHMESALKFSLIGGGGLLIIICLAVIVHRLREDSKEKDHGNMVMTFILLALGLTLGFVLIGVGWTAFSYNPQT